MSQLFLLRHGIALPHGTPGLSDDERPLTSKGERRVRQVGRGLRRLDLPIDRIVTSPLPRARRTAEIVADALGMDDRWEIDDALRPECDAASIRDWLRGRSESGLMLVGHNPSLTDLIGLLVGGDHHPAPCTLRRAGVAALSSLPDGGMTLDWLARPRLFRRLAD
jgi:phosphohistidine phosphatase